MEPRLSDEPSQGSCVGFDIRSRLTFQGLRAGGGTPLYVAERTDLQPIGDLIRTWVSRPDNPFHARLFRDGHRYAFWSSDAGWYHIDPTIPSISVTSGADPLRRELRMFGVPTAICTLAQGDVSIHASAVEIHGQGVLLAGPSKYGKTTLAAAFAQAGHRLLSEDSTRCSTNGPPAIWPGPAVIRLRADVAGYLRVPGAHAASAEEGRVPLVLDERSRGDGGPVPLRAIVILRQDPEATRLQPAPAVEAVRDLLALTFDLPTSSSRALSFARVTDLTAQVDVLNLYRPLTMESLDDVVVLVQRHVGAG